MCEGEVPNELIPIPLAVQNIPGRTSEAKHELVYVAKDLPPLQHTQYCVELEAMSRHPSSRQQQTENMKVQNYDILSSSDGKVFHFNSSSHELFNLEKPDAQGRVREIEFTQKYFYYTGYRYGDRPSGAYVFRPNEKSPTAIGEPTASSTFSGELFHEIHQTFFHRENNKHVSQVIRIPRQNTSVPYDVEIEWMVGPIPIDDNEGKEYIHRIHVNGLENAGMFYTDSNGRQYVERRRNYRPDFDIPEVERQEPVSSNYYPVTSSMYMEDNENNLRLTVLTDRSQGGGSIRYSNTMSYDKTGTGIEYTYNVYIYNHLTILK